MYSNSTPSAPLALTVHRYMICLPQQSEVLDCHHPPVPDKDHSPQPEALLKIFEHALKRLAIAQAAIEDVMGNRPTVDHPQPYLHLTVARLAIATVAKAGQTPWSA